MVSFLDRVIAHKLTAEDLLNVFEVARFSLLDWGISEKVGDGLDLSDECMQDLREKIQNVTGEINIKG